MVNRNSFSQVLRLVECSHALFDTHVGRATASRSRRVPYAAKHGTTEKRSYTLRALRSSLEQTWALSSHLNGRPAASRVLAISWRERFAGVVIIPADTSKRAI
jgi:hypothetical protein